MNIALRLIEVAALLGAAAACADPPPRRAANPSVPPGTERAPNAPYYLGSDPDFPRGRGGRRRP
jgi:hypothetical protein